MNYLDANASAAPITAHNLPVDALGNPSSAHRVGQLTRARIEDARDVIARLLGVNAGRLVFTSGGSESVMTAFWAPAARYATLYLSATDHPIARKSAELLGKRGIRRPHIWSTNKYATPKVSTVVSPAIVSLQVAHSELGTVLTPEWLVQHFGVPADRQDVLLHLDCCQALGKISIEPYLQLADLASFSGHKIGGPAGTGMLYIREGIGELDPLIPGEQEWRRRGGTENQVGIVGLAAAARVRLTSDAVASQILRWHALTSYMREILVREFSDIQLVSPDLNQGLPQTTFIRIPGLRSNLAVIAFDKRGIAISAGTACRSGLVGANETALALGYTETEASEMLRVSFDWDTIQDQVDAFIAALHVIRTGPH